MNEDQKIDIVLTDFKAHTRNFRQPQSFKKSLRVDENTGAVSGRLYTEGKPTIIFTGNKFKIIFPLPKDMKEQIKDGTFSVQTTLPESGLNINFGNDALEKIKSLRVKKDKRLFFKTRVLRKT